MTEIITEYRIYRMQNELAALLINIRSYKCNFLYEFVCMCMYISMSCYYSKYEFLGPDSAGVRGGEVQFEESRPRCMRIVQLYAYRTRVYAV